MSIFEDLIEELKEENLLEETVIKVNREQTVQVNLTSPETPVASAATSFPKPAKSEEADEFSYFQSPEAEAAFLVNAQKKNDEEFYYSGEFSLPADKSFPMPAAAQVLSDAPGLAIIAPLAAAPASQPQPAENDVLPTPDAVPAQTDEREFFRKRAMEEVNGLQMVDHVLSGVERDLLKITPTPYDDLPVKLALHDFIQVAADTKSTEHAQAEFRLMQETENWYSSLSRRDQAVSVADVRHFCENTKPALSPHALIALARFYRNSPYSEAVRSKFDLIVTRLFTGEIENRKRELLLDRVEMIEQIKALYAEWSSIQLYATEEDDSDILLTNVKFENFRKEAESAANFENLSGGDYFQRLRDLKENCQENFFAPTVTAAAIEANVRIGNRFIDLLEKEKENTSLATIEEKYASLDAELVSGSLGKTLELAELLKPDAEGSRAAAEIVDINVRADGRTPYQPRKKERNPYLAANKWLLALTAFVVFVCGGLYFWAEMQADDIKPSPSVKIVNLDNSTLKEYLETARISDEIFYGVTLIAWENLNGEQKEELLKKILSIGGEKGFKKVHLINPAGKTVGFATAEKVEVFHR